MPVTSAAHQPTAGERWRQVPRRWRAVMILAVAAVFAYFASSLAGGLYNPPTGTAAGPSSSTDTSVSGTAAMARLLNDRGHDVQQLTVPLSTAALPTNGTLFVLDPADSILPDATALRRYLDDHGRLVLGGSVSQRLLHGIVGPGPVPVWQSLASGDASPVRSTADDAHVSTVRGGPTGSWRDENANSFRVLLEGSAGAFEIETTVAGGTLVLLASTAPLQNAQLAQADDAALAIDLAGAAGAPVAFDEYDHGLGRSGTGLAGLPSHWKAALALALLAVLLWMWSAARRFGPPQRADRELIPARVAHVDAMASLLASGNVERLAAGATTLQSAGRETLCRVLRASPDATDEQLVELAAMGDVPSVTAEVAAVLLRAPQSEQDVIAEGRAFATLVRHGGQR